MIWGTCALPQRRRSRRGPERRPKRGPAAVGYCSYKYLNGGQGAPANLFVSAERHQGADHLAAVGAGWSHLRRALRLRGRLPTGRRYPRPDHRHPADPLGLAALEAGVDLQLEADPALVETKGLALADLFIAQVEARAADPALKLTGPRNPAERGLHVSFAHPEGYALVQAMMAQGIVGDFRAPDIARFGFSPLFLSYVEAWDAAHALADILASRGWDRPAFRVRAAVT